MSTPVGKTVITLNGLKALVEASSLGRKVKPSYFKVSDTDIGDIYPGIDIKDLSNVWYQAPISAIVRVNSSTVQFILDIPRENASHYGKVFGLYLEDGTLFALSKPPYPFPPLMRQRFKVQFVWEQIDAVMNFEDIPFYEFDQDMTILDLSASLGSRLIKLRKEVELLKNAREVLFENDNEFRNRIENLEQAIKTLWENQLSIFAALATHATLLVQHRQELEKLKGGILQ